MRRLVWIAALALVPEAVAVAQPRDGARDDRPRPAERARDRGGDRDRARGRDLDRDRDRVRVVPRRGPRDTDMFRDGYFDRGGRRIPIERRRRMRARWRPLAQYYAATTSRQFVNVRGDGGRVDRLLVEGVRGAPVIETIAVELRNGQTLTYDLDRRLPRGGDVLIDLPGRHGIQRIIVYTDPRARGAYSIYAD